MDFFAAQDNARKRTSWLIFLFAIAVLGTMAAGYGAALLILARLGARFDPWRPDVFSAVAVGTLLVVGLAAAFKWGQFRAGGAAVAESVGGRRIDPDTTDLGERKLLNVVEEMAIASGVPVPGVYVLPDEPSINAFAAGLTTSDAVVAVNRGTLEKLTRDELQGVVAHEFSHILNGDMRLNVRLTAVLFGILVIGLAGRGVLYSMGRGRVRMRGGRDRGGGIALVLAIGIALMIVGYVGYFFGRLIQAAVSRQREFLADAAAVQFTRNPAGLTGALKKIGGYALGSALQSTKSTAIGHFFFAQAFRSQFGGAWATHPPLADRIHAIDPSFDGTFPEPPESVDVEKEPWVRPGKPRDLAGFAPGALSRPTPAATIKAIGTLNAVAIASAQDLLAGIPPQLVDASRRSDSARVLLYGVLLDSDPGIRGRQRDLVAKSTGQAVLDQLDAIEPLIQGLGAEKKLPLLQLSLPALRRVPAADLESFFGLLDELVHADGVVTPFEFTLQKLILRNIDFGRNPRAPIVQIHSFHPVAHEIAVVLSALAHAARSDTENAFAAGVAHLRLLTDRVALLPAAECRLDRLDAALDKLAAASLPIKRQLLVAAAHTVGADGTIEVEEGELLRAISASLDVPMPILNPPTASGG